MIANLKPYTRMKDSGVNWLGKIPEHWEIRRIRYTIDMRVSNVDKHNKEEEIPVRLCNYVDVYKNEQITSNLIFMKATSTKEEIERFHLQIDDVLITKDSEIWNDIGVPSIVKYSAPDLVCGYHLALLRPFPTLIKGEYLMRVLQSPPISYQFHVAANGVTRYGLSHDSIKNIKIAIPPTPEQSAIVRFIEYYDRKIKRYISAKQKLIKLLEEQKQAIINNAVTGKIDVRTCLRQGYGRQAGKPYPKYKPSGVDWLGKIPEHWEIRRIKYTVDMRVSNVDKHTKENEIPVRLCNYVDVYKNERITSNLIFMKATSSSEEIERFLLQIDDVLITKDSEIWNDIGVPSIVKYSAPDIVCGYHLALLRPYPRLIKGEYLMRVFQSSTISYQFHVAANGVTRYGLSHNSIKNIQIPIPPITEQTEIINFIEEATMIIYKTINNYKNEIDLLREFRTRLISDVVTGKLDVREVAAKLPKE